MKRIILFPIFFVTYFCVNGQHTEKDYCSGDQISFSACFKNDSVLSFHSSKGFVPATLHNLGRQATFPLRMKEKHWLLLGGATVITLTLIEYDEQIDGWIKPWKDKSSFVSTVSPLITDLGDVYGYALLGGFAGYSILGHDYRAFRVSLLAAQAAIASGVWTRIGKTLAGRMRPGQLYGDFEYKEDHWFGPFGQFKAMYNANRGIGAFDAFPSGHTGAAFAIATVFADQYVSYKAVPIIAYSLAGVVGVTRLIEHEHWASDVFVGGLIGYLCGKQVVNYEKKLFGGKNSGKTESRSRSFLLPFSSKGMQGVRWAMIF